MTSLTVTIQIGNSDDKLTQREWSDFAKEIGKIVACWSNCVHFHGASSPLAEWQNACWVVVIDSDRLHAMEEAFTSIRTKYRQDSIAITTGETRFV